MRSPAILLSLAVLAACTSSPDLTSPEAWRRVESERLQRLHGNNDFATAMARLRHAAPGGAVAAAPQEPKPVESSARKLDQIEPPVLAGPRRVQGTNRPVRVEVKAGKDAVAVNLADTQLDDRVDALSLQIGVDGDALVGSGPSLRARGLTSDDDLFAGTFINDGLAPAHADARVQAVRLFPGYRFGMLDGDVTMPVRVGLGLSWFEVDHQRAGVQRSWSTLALRVEAEPAWCVLGDAQSGLDLVGHLGGELGHGWFEERFVNGRDSTNVAEWEGEAGAALRWRYGDGSLLLGAEWCHDHFGESATDLLGQKSGVSAIEQRLYVGGSLRF